jgi:hypothetical protein
MKKTFTYIAIVFSAFSFMSCDKIENPIAEARVYRQDLYGPAPTFTSATAPVQRVLLEDFTGHDCGNCPPGHLEAKAILESRPDHVAVVAVHAGSLAAPYLPDYPSDWRTPEGQYYLLEQVGLDQMPTGRANRRPNAAFAPAYDVWAANVNEALAVTPVLNLQLNANYQAASNHLNVHVNSQWFADLSGEYRLVILVTESHIIAPQLWYNHNPLNVYEYEHEHMLRGSVTGATGYAIITDPQVGNVQTDSYTFDWNSAWDPANCEIVAFVTEGEVGSVINVAKQKLIQ